MIAPCCRVGAAVATIPLAAGVWVVIFAWQPLNFWLLMALGVEGLGALALLIRGPFPLQEGNGVGDLILGGATAAILYGIFVAGRLLTGLGLPSAEPEIGAVYQLRAQAPAWVIVLLLILVIGPGEELYWRGLVQWGLVQRFGAAWGCAGATLLYGFVHIAAGNLLLVLAAIVAGGFWGLVYLRAGRIAPVVVSHIVWDLVVFLVFPLQ